MFSFFKKIVEKDKNSKIEYLSKYRKNIAIINKNNYKSEHIINDLWKDIFNEDESKIRIKKTIELWKKYCGDELRKTILCLEDNLVNVEFLSSENGISVLYEIKLPSGEIGYYEGLLPQNEYEKNNNYWSKFPKTLKKFYNNIHNGFYEFETYQVGILPVQLIEKMSDYEWGVIEDLNLNVEISLEDSYFIFQSGGGGYIVIDTNSNKGDLVTIWFSSKEPMYNKKLWDFLDEWILIGMGY